MTEEMRNAVRRIQVLIPGMALECEKWLSAARAWTNSEALFRSLTTATDHENVLDHLAVLRYALIFRGLGLLPSFEPTGPKGPDLLITRNGSSATVEVTRFRLMNPGPRVWSDGEFLEEYGNPERDIAKCFGKVGDKFPQATGPCAIIAVWSDDEALEELEMEIALRDLQRDSGLPAGLQFVVYGPLWVGNRRFHCFPMRVDLDGQVRRWMHELEAANVDAAIAAVLATDHC